MVEVQSALQCPACGTELSRERGSAGLCPACLIELALEDTALEVELLVDPEEAPTLLFSAEGFSEGEIQGERYRIRSLLGRGGMGEVWRAYDLKLRQEVALKALRSELIRDRDALETLRQEVRTAREVISPNVCRVFDLQELDGRELVSMEYIDGTTLQKLLEERSPLDLDEAREIASQFLAGLEAIHGAGLVHRDVKPENVMVTRTGRVVVMDFGLAKGLGEGKGGVVAGTPAYMSPEQARGGELDPRADVFSAGVVLAEMVAPGGVHTFEDRRRLWEAIHQETPEIAETPWSRVIGGCLARDPEARYATAAELARALEEVTLRAAGDETARPYPGLAAFREEDAEYFYGRELEVEALWKKLRRPHLLAVIGPSGAGKSSFLRAGLLPTLVDGWQAVVATPGNRPLANLARALAPEFESEAASVERLLRFEEPEVAVELLSDWSGRHEHALVIVDQFEELFTQNPPEVQERFAELLGRLPLEADVFVLLAMRDDFLLHCQAFEPLAPLFSALTALGPPTGASLRRAIVQPALKCGYRFEDEALVESMLGEVEGERGALPLVAFAAAQLWERRDRESGLITHEAYGEIGGVGGALGRHAEETLEQISREREPIVRELLRNLVTAQGTRAARDRGELLSVFEAAGASGARGAWLGEATETEAPVASGGKPKRPVSVPAGEGGGYGDRDSAADVLDTLIDARLLTSYEVPADEDGGEPHHRIEIVHESLLANWPRLVRWRMQDAEGAQLRDDLRQAAQRWEAKGRPEDLLWTGTAYREYQLWRERYPGGLTETEAAFAQAMTSMAERRRRRRRIAISAAFVVLLMVLGVIAYLGWQAEQERCRAEAETRRAEASKLLALAELRREEDPTEALAFTTASLELDDTERARVFALRVLWEAPMALELAPSESHGGIRRPEFSPDGSRLAVAGHSENVWVWTAYGKEEPVILPGHRSSPRGTMKASWASNDLLVTTDGGQPKLQFYLWGLPAGEKLRTIDFGGPVWWQAGRDHVYAEVDDSHTGGEPGIYRLRSWELPAGEAEELGRIDWPALGASWSVFDFDGHGWIYGKGKSVFYRPLPMRAGVPDRLIGSHENEVAHVAMPTEADRIWTRDTVTGELRLWSPSAATGEPLRVVPRPAGAAEGSEMIVDPSLRWLLKGIWYDKQARLWPLGAWQGARPLDLRRSGSWQNAWHGFHPSGDWIVVTQPQKGRLTFWPLPDTWPTVVDGYTGLDRPILFSPDEQWLISAWPDQSFRIWPLPGSDSHKVKVLPTEEPVGWLYSIDPLGRFLVTAPTGGNVHIVPLDGSPPRELEGFTDPNVLLGGVAVSPSGRQLVAAHYSGEGEKTLRVWDLETGELRRFELPDGSPLTEPTSRGGVSNSVFTDESTLYTAGDGGVYRWDLESGSYEQIYATDPGYEASMTTTPPGPMVLVHETRRGAAARPLKLLDLATGVTQSLPAFGKGSAFTSIAFSGEVVVTGDEEGVLRVGHWSDLHPHLLVGHEGAVQYVAISPDGRWIASTGEGDTLRLWPMPDLSKPPLHTLPHDELIAKLESLTNLRAVRDPESADGWSVTLDPFPGWQEVPEW